MTVARWARERKVYLVIGAALCLAMLILWAPLDQPTPEEPPRMGALTTPSDLQLAREPVLTFGDKTTLSLGDSGYAFGPGSRMARDSKAPVVLGLGQELVQQPGYKLSTEIGFGKLLDQESAKFGESLTHLSSEMSGALNTRIDMSADYQTQLGESTERREWGVKLNYRVNEHSNWQLQHREYRASSEAEADQHVTEMEYKLRF